MEKEVFNLDEKLQAMKSDPSAKEKLDKEKAMLEEDIRKFHALIDGFKCNIMELEKGLERMEKELEMKNSKNQKIIEENMELKKFLES
ncbi:hypothetical protein IFM89_020046 [Coptis chinensis]|uniref:Uncharacterized protein n=1 Tax=Coptis chinensis TaxID=261450 RepID=A0A835MFG5_9MAGN|nr:hypothetical protein IFM89_020046 [Coptis chinensis]